MTDQSSGRGQLVVAGSVVIAVVIVAVAVLTNAALYTEEVASADDSRVEVATAERYQRIAQTDLARVVNETVGGTERAPEAALRRNVSAYAGQLERAAGRSVPTAIQIELAAASPPMYRFTFAYDSPSVHYRANITVRAGES